MIDIEQRKKEIGKRIKYERKRLGWSQEKFSEKLSEKLDGKIVAAQNTISNWENGKNFPDSLDVFFAMSQLFNCDCGYLLCDYDERTHNAKEISILTGLSDKSINALCNLKSWKLEKELASVIDALILDYQYATKGEDQAPLVYLIYWFLNYSGNGKPSKAIHLTGEIIDFCGNGYIPSSIRLNERTIENAALAEIEQGLVSLKKRLGRERTRKNGKHNAERD